MKRNISMLIILFVCIFAAACAVRDNSPKEVLLQIYQDTLKPFDIKPLSTATQPEEYAFLLTTYSGADAAVAVGQLDNYTNIYTTPNQCAVSDICVHENYILWFESQTLTDENSRYKLYLYDHKTKLQAVIFEEEFNHHDGWYVTGRFGIYKHKVYWLHNDFAQKTSEILVYDIAAKTQDVLLSAPFLNNSEFDAAVSCLKVHDNLLVYNQQETVGQKLLVFDLEKNEKAQEALLDSAVGPVFAVDFEEKTDTFALYYSALNPDGTEKNEAVGVINTNAPELLELFSLNPNHYLYRERLSISGCNIYYDVMANVSGHIEDHYSSAIYNYQNHDKYLREYTFNTMLIEDVVYFLSFEKDQGAGKTFFYKGQVMDAYTK